MDRNQPPDDDFLDESNELVAPADGGAPPSGTSEGPDLVSLRMFVGGSMIMGIILVSRVKQFGSVEFFEGIPDKLSAVLQAGLELSSLTLPPRS